MFRGIAAAAAMGMFSGDIMASIIKCQPNHGGGRTLYTVWKQVQRERPNGGWFVDDRPPFGRQQLRYASRMAAKESARQRNNTQTNLRSVRLRNRNRVIAKPAAVGKTEATPTYAWPERLAAVAIKRADQVHRWPSEGGHQQLRDSLAGPGAFDTPRQRGDVEGFVTDRGRFVDRHDAQIIAFAAGQIAQKQSRALLSSDIDWNAGQIKAAA